MEPPDRAGPSLALRAALAVGLTISFYAFSVALAAGLWWGGVAVLSETRGSGSFKIALFCFVGGGLILWSIFPRTEKHVSPGPLLDRSRQPRLFAELEGIAKAAGQGMPADVYLVPDLNAGVYQTGGILGFGGRRRMVLGLPLLAVLRVSELRGVLAHEFGHYLGGETKLGPWIYQTRAAIGRTVASLSEAGSLLRFLFIGYGKLFLRITLAISRRQELAADALAARVVGAAPLASGLRRTAGASPFFQTYFGSELVPVLASGFRPPIAEGFHRFLRAGTVAEAVEGFVRKVALKDRGDPYDSHPPLRERLAALGSPPGLAEDPGDPAAIALLECLPALEQELLLAQFPALKESLPAIRWEDAGFRVFLPLWRKQVMESRALLGGHTPATLGSALAPPPPDRQNRLMGSDRTPAQYGPLPPLAVSGGLALAVLLVDRGWNLRCLPGSEVTLQKDGDVVAPFRETAELTRGKLSPTQWLERWRRYGLADEPLVAPGESKA